VAASCCLPFETVWQLPYIVAGRPLNGRFHGFAGWTFVSPKYFEALRIPILRGRAFTDQDDAAAPGVIIINQAMARLAWPDGDPLNDRLLVGRTMGPEYEKDGVRQIVGIAGDVRDVGLNRRPRPAMYVPIAQVPEGVKALTLPLLPIAWIVRSHGKPQGIAAAVTNELRLSSGGLPVARTRSLQEVVAQSTARTQFNMALMTVFGCAALLLAAIGIYGLMAYSIRLRTHEIGVRLALGAQPEDVRRMMLWQGMRLILIGVAIGIPAAFGLTRLNGTPAIPIRSRLCATNDFLWASTGCERKNILSAMRAFSLIVIPLALSGGVADQPDVLGQERLFESWIHGQMSTRHLPGIALGVVFDQQLIWAKGFGMADVDGHVAMTPATKFRMASHSKLFTSTAIMQLRDGGKLRLDDPVSKYLPWFKPKPAEPDDPEITIEELVTHSSGLPREAGPHWTTHDFPTAEQVRSYIAEHQAIYSPEVRWKYSNLALGIAGMVVEALSGEKYPDYVKKHIFGPLGMNASSVDQQVDGLAVGYGRLMPDGPRKKIPFIDARALGSATGITSNVEDMAKFVSLQFSSGRVGGNQILSTGALREMHRVRVLENDWTRGNAIGFAVNREKDKIYVGHGGSYPGYKTQTLIDLDGKVGVIVLTNEDDGNPGSIATHLMNTVGQAVAKAGAPAPKSPVWDPTWTRFAGHYSSEGGETDVVELNQRLVMFNPDGENPEAQQRLEPVGNGRFRLESPTGGSAVGEIVRFVEENGRVVRMYTGESFSNRVNP
jgi:D-alanyl-D-alanine carboxypeptidase